MDSSCAILRGNAIIVKSRKRVGGRRCSTGFWGETTRGSHSTTRFLSIQTLKNSKSDTKFKPGVAYSVLTPDINKESVVTILSFAIRWIIYNIMPNAKTVSWVFDFGFQVYQTPNIEETQEADPKSVASIILGGGAGTRLFPLTGRRAKPAVWSFNFLRLFVDILEFLCNWKIIK